MARVNAKSGPSSISLSGSGISFVPPLPGTSASTLQRGITSVILDSDTPTVINFSPSFSSIPFLTVTMIDGTTTVVDVITVRPQGLTVSGFNLYAYGGNAGDSITVQWTANL